MENRRIVITGMGVITPLGNTVDEYWKNLLSGKSGAGLIDRFDTTGLSTKFACCIKDFDPYKYIEEKSHHKMIRRLDTFAQYSTGAIYEALKDAGLTNNVLDKIDRSRIGIVVGSGIGGINVFCENVINFQKGGQKKVSPFFIPMIITNIAAGMAAIIWGLKGPNFSISTACATSNHCIIDAFNIIKRGEADIMVSGGTEGAITPVGLAGFCACKALSERNDAPEKASRPFDVGRDGFVMGEGAGIIIIESLESATKRGAKIYAELLGGGMSCDGYHLTDPCENGEGAAIGMMNAMKNCGITIDDVDYINTHGTSTPKGDVAEIMAIKKVFGEKSHKLKINSTKSMTGHLLGAAGGVEAVACIKSIQENKLHPTINIEKQDPDCDLDCIPNNSIDHNVRIAISNSFGFGGHNSTIVFKKFEK